MLAAVIGLVLAGALAILVLHPAPYLVNMVGQLAAFAILAVSLDLVWGYLGILSLGHGLFFAIGGYVCAMHLLSHAYAVTGVAPDLMQFMGWKTLPLYWSGLASAPYALVVALVLSAAIAFLFGYASFRSRVNGVYFSIISQALVYVAMLLMFRNDTGLGGNNGMTGFPLLFGYPIGAPGMVTGLTVATLLALALILVGTRALVVGRIGPAHAGLPRRRGPPAHPRLQYDAPKARDLVPLRDDRRHRRDPLRASGRQSSTRAC